MEPVLIDNGGNKSPYRGTRGNPATFTQSSRHRAANFTRPHSTTNARNKRETRLRDPVTLSAPVPSIISPQGFREKTTISLPTGTTHTIAEAKTRPKVTTARNT